ncbi:MAG: hypothetical protein R3F39_04155 [Myxococcota bacterium]
MSLRCAATLFVCLSALISGCDDSPGAGADATADVTKDAAAEVATDADVAPDVAVDATPDSALDAETGPDAVTPPLCPESPDFSSPLEATEAAETCTAELGGAAILGEGVTATRLALAMTGLDAYVVAAATGESVTLWTVAPGAETASESWPAEGLRAGPFLAISGKGAVMVSWGDALGLRFARPGEAAVTSVADAAPVAMFARPDGGARVLFETPETLFLLTTDAAGAEEARHFVNSRAKVARAFAHEEDGFVLVPYTGPAADQPLFYQTSSLQGGECSLPVPFGVAPGADAQLAGTGLAYGLALMAWTRPASADCARREVLHVRTLNELVFSVPSAVAFGSHVEFLAAGPLAAAVTVSADEAGTGWRVVSQFLDLANRVPGAATSGFGVSDASPPEIWTAGRYRGKYRLVWADGQTVKSRAFCFQ